MKSPDLNKTLQELEKHDWGEPTYDSHLVKTCHALRRKPLRDFEVEDLRIMIGQNISLPYLIPMALEVLETNPFVSGDFYEGDLLQATLKAEKEYWITHPEQKQKLLTIIEASLPSLDTLDVVKSIKKSLLEAYEGLKM